MTKEINSKQQRLKENLPRIKSSIQFSYYPYLIGLCIAFIPLGVILYYFHGEPSTNYDDWGNFGQYIAGTVGTVISAVTILLVVQSIRIQTREFNNMLTIQKRTFNVLQNQNLENTFFNLLDLHHRIAENIIINYQRKVYKGRDGIILIIKECAKMWDEGSVNKKESIKNLLSAQKENFNHYISNIKNTIDIHIDIEDNELKNKFLNIFKNQMSNSELALIGYVALFFDSDLKEKINNIDFIENIDFELDCTERNDKIIPTVIKQLIEDII